MAETAPVGQQTVTKADAYRNAASVLGAKADLDTVPALAQIIKGISGRLNQYFEELAPWKLAKQPEARYQTATEFLKELTRVGKFNGMTV